MIRVRRFRVRELVPAGARLSQTYRVRRSRSGAMATAGTRRTLGRLSVPCDLANVAAGGSCVTFQDHVRNAAPGGDDDVAMERE